MNGIFYISEAGAVFLESFLCYCFINLFSREPEKNRTLAFHSALLTAVHQIMGYWDVMPEIQALFFVFYICATSVILFQTDIFFAVSLVSFFVMCIYIIDFFSISEVYKRQGLCSKYHTFLCIFSFGGRAGRRCAAS